MDCVLQCECHQRAACPDPACVLCSAFCLVRVPVVASLLLHCTAAPRPPARCAALPCNTRTTPTHTLDQPASDLKASDDGAPLLHCDSPALVRTALSVLLHDCALHHRPRTTAAAIDQSPSAGHHHCDTANTPQPPPPFPPPRATDRPPPLSRPPPCLPAFPTGSTRSVHTRLSAATSFRLPLLFLATSSFLTAS